MIRALAARKVEEMEGGQWQSREIYQVPFRVIDDRAPLQDS